MSIGSLEVSVVNRVREFLPVTVCFISFEVNSTDVTAFHRVLCNIRTVYHEFQIVRCFGQVSFMSVSLFDYFEI